MSRRRYVAPVTRQPTADEARLAMSTTPSAQIKPAPAAKKLGPTTVSIRDWVRSPEDVRKDMGLRDYA